MHDASDDNRWQIETLSLERKGFLQQFGLRERMQDHPKSHWPSTSMHSDVTIAAACPVNSAQFATNRLPACACMPAIFLTCEDIVLNPKPLPTTDPTPCWLAPFKSTEPSDTSIPRLSASTKLAASLNFCHLSSFYYCQDVKSHESGKV